MKKLFLILIATIMLLGCNLFAQENCTLSGDGTNVTVSNCSPTLLPTPFTATVNFTPSYESCTITSDGLIVSVSDCSPVLLSAPFTATITFTPAYVFADNRYCGKGNVARFGNSDGPAQLPQACFYTALDATPSPGKVTTVAAGDLTTALNAASCGDTLLLDHTAVYVGRHILPAKQCDDQHWITIRTDTSDSLLPIEGTRITPNYTSLLPKLVLSASSGNYACQLGANHYRLIGLNFVKAVGAGTLNAFFNTSGCSQLIFDRILMAGNSGEESCHGVQLTNSTFVGVIDSYIHEMHGLSGQHSSCDAQAVSGGNGTTTMGSYKIVNNYLEASGENVMFGGGPGTLVPFDIEIRRNDMFKPMSWINAIPTGEHYITKNLFELKNAGRLLFEDNHMVNNWGGYTQNGHAVVLTAKNQGNANASVHDITMRSSTISHSCTALSVAFIANDKGVWAASQYNLSLHDIVVDNLLASDLTGCGNYLNQVMTGPGIAPPQQPMTNVSLYNITETLATNHLSNAGFSTLGGSTTYKMSNFSWTNSSIPAGVYGLWSTGGINNCATIVPTSGGPKAKFDNCFANYVFTGNNLPGGLLIHGQAVIWPDGNTF